MTSVGQGVSSDSFMPSSRKRRLPLVCEADATGRTLDIYQEIKLALGVPYVNVLFQAYGAHPKFLDAMWQQLRPAIATREFFSDAERLGAEAYTWMHNYFSIPDLCEQIREIHFSTGAQHELTDVVELFHYNNPVLLLIAAIQLQAFEDGPKEHRTVETKAEHPVFSIRPIRITEEAAPLPIRKIYDDIKRTLGLSYITTDYQSFARWPDFLSAYWNALKPALLSPIYGESKHSLGESALALASELPNAPHLSTEYAYEMKLSADEITTGIHITEEFLEGLSGLVLNVDFARIGLDGGNQVRPFSKWEKGPGEPASLNQPRHAA
jgi:hypothetical protein